MGAIRLTSAFELPGNAGGDDFAGENYSRDALRQGRFGHALRRSNAADAATVGTTTSFNNPALRWRMRVRGYPIGGDDSVLGFSNSRGSTGDTYLVLGSAGQLTFYNQSTSLGATGITILPDRWYQCQLVVAWGFNESAPEPDIPAVFQFTVIDDLTLVHQTWTSSLGVITGYQGGTAQNQTGSQVGVLTHILPVQVGLTVIRVGQEAAFGVYFGSRVDVDSVSAEPDDGTWMNPGAGVGLSRLFVPTRLRLTGTLDPGGWVLDGTATPADYLMLEDDAPTSLLPGSVTSSTALDTLEMAIGAPLAQGFNEATCYGILLSVYLVTSAGAGSHVLSITIGATTYTLSVSAASSGWKLFWLPTRGTPEFTSFSNTDPITVGFTKSNTVNTVRVQAISVQVVGTQDWTPAAPTVTTVKLASGHYTGNGTAQAIACGLVPHWLWILPTAGGNKGIHWYDVLFGASDWTLQGQRTNECVPTPTGFQVQGSAATSNQPGVEYRWYAIQDGTQRLLYRGAFSERTGANYLITDGLGVLPVTYGIPQGLWAHIEEFTTPTGTLAGYFRGLSQAATQNCSPLSASVEITTGIRSLPSAGAGFEIGTTLQGLDPQVAFTCWFTDFATTKLWDLVSYVGDGAGSQVVAVDLGGRRPGWMLAIPRSGGQRYLFAACLSLNLASGSVTATAFTGVAGNQFTVGSALNASGVTYEILVLADPSSGTDGSGGCEDGLIQDIPAAEQGCQVSLAGGSDSGGGTGCNPLLGVGSDSGGGAGCQVSF